MQLSLVNSTILYTFVILAAFTLSKTAEKKNSFLPLLCLILISAVVTGFRSARVGIDTSQYIALYESGQYTYLKDIGFIWLTAIIKKYFSVHIYLFIIALLTYYFFIRGLWHLRNISSLPMTVVFFYLTAMFTIMNTIRQYLALAVICYAFHFLLQRKEIWFTFFIVIASLIHVASLLAFALLAVDIIVEWKRVSVNKKLVLFAALSLSPAIIFWGYTGYFGAIIISKVEFYLSSVHFTKGAFGIIQVVLTLIIVAHLLRLTKNDEKKYEVREVAIISIIGIIGTLLGYYFTYMNRIFLTFSIFTCVTYAALWKRNYYQLEPKQPFTLKLEIYRVAAFLLMLYPFISAIISDGYKTMNYSMFFW